MNIVTLVVVLVAFAIGYKLISWLMDRFRLSRTAPDTTESAGDASAIGSPTGSPSVSWRTGFAGSGPGGSTQRQPYEPPESRYARILNLPRVYTGSEITTNYRQLIAQHHPDKVRHLSPDLQEIARRKSREIVEAYEYFRVKYNLR
jgi:DnaJ domain